jgi:hypothetical protein
MDKNKKFFIRPKGQGELKTYHLIDIDTFDMLDMFFNSEIEAKQYAQKKALKIVNFKETFNSEQKEKPLI